MTDQNHNRGPIIRAEGLTKRYGSDLALDHFDLVVAEGTVVALLGPNGAGKTTTVSILTTLLEPDGGTATVAGADVRREAGEVRKRIGLSGQYAAVDEHLTGFENLEMIGMLYRLGRGRARARADELLERFGLTEVAHRPARTYSGGMRRRLDLAGALVAEARVLFLDEPTTGLDPRSRAELWDVIRDLVARGSTVLLTTQYMEEADQLADDIVVIDHGREIAHGTADELKARIGGERIELRLRDPKRLDEAWRLLATHAAAEPYVALPSLVIPVVGGSQTLTTALRSLDAERLDVIDIALRRPTLDDVFLSLTGHTTSSNDAEEARTGPSPVPSA
jgi:ABC-2 type transport system ATP-binding protein